MREVQTTEYQSFFGTIYTRKDLCVAAEMREALTRVFSESFSRDMSLNSIIDMIIENKIVTRSILNEVYNSVIKEGDTV